MKRALFLLAGAALASEPPKAEFHSYATYVMGTVATVKLYAADEATARRLAGTAFAELRRLEDIFTNYRDSELTRLNRQAVDNPVRASDDMYALVAESLAYWRKYEGTFDVTIGPAIRAWGFLGGPPHIPDAFELEKLRERIGMGGVDLNRTAHSVRFRRSGMELDFGGIAKGYAAEKAARLLERAGVARALIDFGESSFYSLGPPPGEQGWPVSVIDPRTPDQAVEFTQLPPFSALSTSGTYGRTFTKEGRTYSHLFDPRSAAPVNVEASVTVICRSGAESEAAAKAVLLLSPAKRRALRGVEWLRLEVRNGALVRERSRAWSTLDARR